MAVLALLGSLAVAAPANAVVDASASVAAAAPAAVDTAVDSGIVKAAAVVGFNPENIISDSLFYDGKAMTAAEIQSFLDAKIGSCRNGKCLNVLNVSVSSRDAWVSQVTGNLVCSALQGGTMRVSELIYRIQVACGVSAKVILVTLQKEQGLTTSDAPSDWNLQAAMGASCPDTAPCDPAYSGVGPQIVQGVRQIKIYKAGRFAMQPGVNYIGYNPNSACGGTNLNIQNYATAALYNYTPYQPNAASLAAGWGLGDGCSSYGNRNFYNYYTSWFGSTQRSVCDQPPFNQVRSASGRMVAVADVPARATADENCNVGAVWLPKGMLVSVSAEYGEWFWVDVNGAMYWMRKAHLAAYDPCTQPPYDQVRGADGEFTTSSAITARVSANEECGTGAAPVGAGTRVSRAATWGEWSWVSVAGDMYWVKTSQLAAAVSSCSQPPYGQVVGAAGSLVAAASTARIAPSTDCATGAVSIAAGTVVQAAAVWADWYWVDYGGAMLWMRKADLTAAAACSQPPYEQVRGASGTFAAVAATARQAPSTTCGTGSTPVAGGTRVSVAASWGDWYWVNLSGSMLWMRKGDLAPVPVCSQPPYEQVSGASGMFKTSSSTNARTAPDTGCETGTQVLSAGTAVKAVASWSNWYWVEVNGSNYWIRKDLLTSATCSQPKYEEVRGASGTKRVAASAIGRTAPAVECSTDSVPLSGGTDVTLAAEWGDWYWVKSGSSMLWVLKSDLADPGALLTTTASLNLRGGPTTDAQILAVIPAGATVRQVGTSGDWRQVIYGTTTGWVSAAYVR